MAASSDRIGLEVLARRSGVEPAQLRAVFESIISLLEEGRRITVPDFGSFRPAFTEPRPITSPIIPAGSAVVRRRKIKFAMSESLRKKWVLEAKS